MRKVKIYWIVPVIVFGLFVLSCTQSSKKTGEETSVETSISKEELRKDVEEVIYPLPTPFELYQKLESIGASYVGNVLNPVKNLDNYYTEKSKALALGVYGADLSYSATYNKEQESKLYSNTLKSILDDLGVDVKFAKLLSEEHSEKFDNKDTLVNFITNTFYDTYSFLYEESEPALAGLMVAGIWIESLYIATHISKDTYNNYEMVNLIYNQSKSLEKVILLLDKFKDKELVASISNALKKLKIIFEKTDGSLTKEQLENISTTIGTIRSSIIS